jgi:hypothetical protein
MPPAAKNPFEKGFLDLPKFFIKVFLRPVFFVSLRVSSRFKKISGGSRKTYELSREMEGEIMGKKKGRRKLLPFFICY